MNTIGTGLETRAIWELSRIAWHRALGWRYRRIFGSEVGKGRLHLIYGLLDPPQAVNQAGAAVRHIFAKRESPELRFSVSGIASICEVRAATYVAESVTENTGRWIILRSDRAVRDSLDLSFVSFGIANNEKTKDLLKSPTNQLVRFKDGLFVTVSGRTIIRPSNDPQIDYGMILKGHPQNIPERNWIACGGYDEWGTSGAAWYLARRWRDIYKKFGNKPFAIFVKIEGQKDESANPIIMAASPEEIERQARD